MIPAAFPTSLDEETSPMSQNLKTALEESGRVLDLIGHKTLSPEEQKRVIEGIRDSLR